MASNSASVSDPASGVTVTVAVVPVIETDTAAAFVAVFAVEPPSVSA